MKCTLTRDIQKMYMKLSGKMLKFDDAGDAVV